MKHEVLFRLPPRHLELRDGEAHVFCAALDLPPARLEHCKAILSEDERARAARFVFARDRNRFVAGRGMLREILGRLLPADPARLVFAYGDHGKPRLAARLSNRFLHFNLAHSEALAVYIVSARDEVGIDVERVRDFREAESVAARFFSARENAEWRSLPAARQTGAFFQHWTRAEALVKAAGGSLGALRLNTAETAPDFSDFFLHLLTPAHGYQAAAATKSVCAPRCWQWPAG